MSNQVYRSIESKIPLTLRELVKISGIVDYDLDRIKGDHCECTGGGEFVLLPDDDPLVIEGGKRYMYCRNCNCFSHL